MNSNEYIALILYKNNIQHDELLPLWFEFRALILYKNNIQRIENLFFEWCQGALILYKNNIQQVIQTLVNIHTRIGVNPL